MNFLIHQGNTIPKIAELRQNRAMSLFEQFLTYGEAISQEEKFSLYKFLLQSKQTQFKTDAQILLQNKQLASRIADGEIKYSIRGRNLSYVTKRIDGKSFTQDIRSIRLSLFKVRNILKLKKFFAQAEVDVLSNYPYQGEISIPESGFGYLVYPYYDLNYFSKGKGRVRGFFIKLKVKDDELLEKLLASQSH